MLTIGRTLDVNPIFSIIIAINFVNIGNHRLLLLSIKKDALIKLLVHFLMVGKSKNIILYSIKRSLVMNSQLKTFRVIKNSNKTRTTKNINKLAIKRHVQEVKSVLISTQSLIVVRRQQLLRLESVKIFIMIKYRRCL